MIPLAVMSALFLAGQASDPTSSDKILKELQYCRSLSEAARRLECFDAVTGTLMGAVSRDELVLVDRTMATEAKRRRFGLPTAPENSYGKVEASAPTVSELTSTLTAVSGFNGGRWNVTLADGSIWQLTESPYLEPRAGRPIRIKRGAMSNFMAYIGKSAPVRAKRLR